MTLKTPVTDPLDRYTRAEWRTELCALLGIDYSSQPTAWQTMFDSVVAETEDYLLKRAAGKPWGEREQSSQTVSAGTDTTYAFPDDFREAIWIREESSTRVLLWQPATKRAYGEVSPDYGTSHPWTSSVRPYWFFDGHDTDTPAQQQWRRIGADNAGATLRIFYIPYFSLSTPELPASERAAARIHALATLKMLQGDLEGAKALTAFEEREIEATDTLGRETVDAPVQQGMDSEFARQMG